MSKQKKWAHDPGSRETPREQEPIEREPLDLNDLLERRDRHIRSMTDHQLKTDAAIVSHVRVRSQRGFRGWLSALLFGRRCVAGCRACAIREEIARRGALRGGWR